MTALLPLFSALAATVASVEVLAIPGAAVEASGPKIHDLASLRVNQVHSGVAVNAAWKLLGDYQRWGAEPPTGIADAAATQTASVSAPNTGYDLRYYAPVTVGSNQLNLDFDTGSSDLWVFSKQLPAAVQKNHNIYQDTGTKITKPKEHWSIQYVDGSGSSGNVWVDTFAVGGATVTQAIEAATSVAPSFQTLVPDGLLGLAFESINTCRPRLCNTFMTQLSPSLPAPLFTASLRHNKPGTYDFGYIDSTQYTGSIGYTPADNSTGFWGLDPTGYSIGSAAQTAYSFAAVADTGTSLLYLPTAVVQSYYGQVTGAYLNQTTGQYLFPCKSKPPNFSIYINGHQATVPGSYIKVGRLFGKTCLGGMQDYTTLGAPASLLGDTFLKSQFVVFNLQGPQLGFAQQVGIPSS